MPNLDGTGPMGRGAMTGRGLGKCKETFTAKTARIKQIQHEGDGPHPPHRLPAQPVNDVFMKRNQQK